MSVFVGIVGVQNQEPQHDWLSRNPARFATQPSELPLVIGEVPGPEPARPIEFAWSAQGTTAAIVIGRLTGSVHAASDLADAFAQDGSGALQHVVGPFAVAFVRRADGVVTLARSASGQQPIYYAQTTAGWIFAPTVGALLACPSLEFALDSDALADSLHHGIIWGEKTLARRVSLLLPGCTVELDPARRETSQRSFVVWPRGDERPDDIDAIETIDAALGDALRRAIERDPNTALCLSAGLDSRTLLGVASRIGAPPRCITNGLEGSIELDLAVRMCQEVGSDHLICKMGSELVESIDDLARGVSETTDGEADLMNMMMLHVGRRYRDEFGLAHVIRGHGGELMKLDDAYGFALPPELVETDDHERALARLQDQLTASVPEESALRLLSATVARDGRASSATRLGQRYRSYTQPGAYAGQAASILFLCEYNGRHTMNAMRCLGASVGVALPFLDDDVLLATLSSRLGLRATRQLQISLIERNHEGLLQIPNSAIRTSLTAGPLRRRMASLRFRIESRLGMHQTDVPERWLITRLGSLFERILLDERCLDRGLVVPDEARRMVGDSLAGQRRANTLLGRMTVVELFLRRVAHETPAT